ncbi:DoxX family membrane protein [Corynebacterium incognita]|uniref:DoxX family membrane protein n=1 Tax=Corynebacterium incognita TaxID=2754725 RepID=A0A7G7CPH4_9CORY|nr:DoxX family protein [Corynebacterium incognita]QNE89490.1 DoxX family membrane protein [Corynebacterium incognita]
MLRKIARPMLASIFVVEGADMLRNADKHKAESEQVLAGLRKVLPADAAGYLPKDAELFTRAVGGTKAGAGSLLALGKAPRTSAAVLAATTLPAMFARNSFWNATTPEEKENQRSKFLVDTALLGALFITTQDTEGKPGISWRAQQANKQLQKKLPSKNEQNQLVANISDRTNEFSSLAQDKFATASERAQKSFNEASARAQDASAKAQAYVDDNKDGWAETAQGLLATAKSYVDDAKSYYADNKEDWLKAAQDNAQLARTKAVKNATKAQAKADQALAQVDKKKSARALKNANKNASKLQKRADKAIAEAMKKSRKRIEA